MILYRLGKAGTLAFSYFNHPLEVTSINKYFGAAQHYTLSCRYIQFPSKETSL